MGQKQSRLEELLLPHLDGAYNLARWLIENDQAAQAIILEAYLQAKQEFGEPYEADARHCLVTIVRKRAHTWIQEHGKSPTVIPFVETFPEEPSAAGKAIADTWEKQVAQASDEERKRLFCEALRRLPVEFREILVLHYVEGWTYTQLGSALEIPQAKVLYRLSMARRSLRHELGRLTVGS
jgi:RNA polymerase sigma-70 factor (ECF subfamily)